MITTIIIMYQKSNQQTKTREQQLEVYETSDSKELKVTSAKCLRLLPVVLVLRILFCLHHWLLKQHLADDSVSAGQTEDNIALCMRRMMQVRHVDLNHCSRVVDKLAKWFGGYFLCAK